jgi:predicted nucleotidyltransferase
MVSAAVPIPYEQIAGLCQRHGIARLELFGSVLRDDFDPSRSDIDVPVGRFWRQAGRRRDAPFN